VATVVCGTLFDARFVLWVNKRLPAMLSLLLDGNTCKALPSWTGPCDPAIGIESPGDQSI